VAALTGPAIERGVTAPSSSPWPQGDRWGAGGKDIPGDAGGKDGAKVADALGGIRRV